MKNLFNKNIVYFAKIKENAKIPNKKDEDAGYDIFACFDEDFIYLKQGETKCIKMKSSSARTVEQNLFSLQESKNFTLKRVWSTNRKDAPNAEKTEDSITEKNYLM